MNPDLIGAVKVPDGSVDPFRLCAANMLDAKLHGGQVRLHTEVTGFIREGNTIKGVHTLNHQTGEETDYYAPITVNACGIWGQHIAELAGVRVGMFPAKGALLIFAHRVNNMVINRCRKPSNADILVPGDTVCVIGTTSTRIPFEECDNVAVTPDEVTLLITEGAKLAPSLSETRILRAYAGVRPLVSADDDPSGRNISRGIVCLDHEERDGLHRMPGSRRKRRTKGLYHHHRRQTHDLPAHGGNRHGSGMQETGGEQGLYYCRDSPARLGGKIVRSRGPEGVGVPYHGPEGRRIAHGHPCQPHPFGQPAGR